MWMALKPLDHYEAYFQARKAHQKWLNIILMVKNLQAFHTVYLPCYSIDHVSQAEEHRNSIQTGWQDVSILPSIFLPAWHVYLVFHVSLVQHCAYAYRVMKVQKLVPEGSCTYSTDPLKPCQGGPHLQSNLTTTVKYSTTSNPILAMPTVMSLQFTEGGDWSAMSWLCWQAKKSQFIQREPSRSTGAHLWPGCQYTSGNAM